MARRPRRRRGRRRLTHVWTATGALLVMAPALLTGCSSSATPADTPTATTVPEAKSVAVAFLDRYVDSDGRVVRIDQGGDTASEGQAYALLLAVATHDASRFGAVWTWEKDNLQLPDGLFAYLWSDGAVVGSGAATDADLDTAWALVLAATSFHQPEYLKEGRAVAAAILANETVVSGGRLQLVAGPWARSAPYAVDPSYFSPEAMTALAKATDDPLWTELAVDSQQLVSDLQGSGATRSLPPDWAALSQTGEIAAAPSPSGGAPPSYGLDAQRLPVWYAADCAAQGRSLSADSWPIIAGLAASGSYLAYTLTGGVQQPYSNDLGLVAAAASAMAAGQVTQGRALLAQAQRGTYGKTYYGDAWVALGTVLLTTDWLSPCPPAPAT